LEAAGSEGASWSFSLWRSSCNLAYSQRYWAHVGSENGDHTFAEGRRGRTFSVWRSPARPTESFSESQPAYVQQYSAICSVNRVGGSENEPFRPEHITQVIFPVFSQRGPSEPFSACWPVSAASSAQKSSTIAAVRPESLLLRPVALEESPSSGVVWWWCCCRRSDGQHAGLCVGDWTFRTGM
jgi:hypothetical protein